MVSAASEKCTGQTLSICMALVLPTQCVVSSKTKTKWDLQLLKPNLWENCEANILGIIRQSEKGSFLFLVVYNSIYLVWEYPQSWLIAHQQVGMKHTWPYCDDTAITGICWDFLSSICMTQFVSKVSWLISQWVTFSVQAKTSSCMPVSLDTSEHPRL